MSEITKLEPKLVWELFDAITRVPRPSKKEEKIREFLVDFAKKHNIDYQTDQTGNVVMRVPGTKGYENRPCVILQSHMDMVCEKNSDTAFDFDKDPIRTKIVDGWVKAEGTTLGADDGIGMAAALAALLDPALEHGPLEALFTVDEETGLTGAFGLGKGMLTGRYLVNLDSEDEGEIFIGCAGGGSNLGGLIAREIGDELGIPSYIVDPVVIDEMADVARYAGHPLFQRVSIFHALNQKATARLHCERMGWVYEESNLIVAHMGGGISVGAHCLGRVIDVNNALGGEGPFTPERCGTLPAMQLVELCYSGKYTLRQMKRMICGKGGLAAWLGSNDMIGLSARAEAGEEPYATVVGAMMYTVAKEIGSMYVALGGKVDAIIVTGGIAHDTYCVDRLRPQVEYMAPVVVMPGENEMLSLAFNALGALRGELELMEYTGDDCREGIVSPVAID